MMALPELYAAGAAGILLAGAWAFYQADARRHRNNGDRSQCYSKP